MKKMKQLICNECGTPIDNINGGSGDGRKCVCHRCSPIKIGLMTFTFRNQRK